MDNTDEAKSTQRQSEQSSQGKNRRRPSLFPIRNSAQRRNSFSEHHHLFDPHINDKKQNINGQETSSTYSTGHVQERTQAQFQFHTPSQHSSCLSPRTPRSTPKQYDTPFVPFTHQSLSRTIWQSQQVIPEQKYEFDKKQSQIQPHKEEAGFIQDSLNGQSQHQQQKKNEGALYPQLSTYKHINYEDHIKQQETQYEAKGHLPVLQVQYAVSVNILGCDNRQKRQDLEEPNNQQIQNERLKLKQQLTGENLILNQISHQVYISKAQMYYNNEEQNKRMLSQFKTSLQCQQSVQPKKRSKLSFSYLQSVVVRPAIKTKLQNGQQTQKVNLSAHKTTHYNVFPKINNEQELCQKKDKKLSIHRHDNSQIKAIKKNSQKSQTNFYERLKLISETYHQKIGCEKFYVSKGEQTKVQTSNCYQQTEQQNKRKQFSISQQTNVSMNYDYGKFLDKQINRFQQFMKSYCDQREIQISNLKCRKYINAQTNTQNQPVAAAASQISSKQSPTRKSMRSFGCQYDTKDTGNRPSLKRVSIADKKIIFIQDSNSTETYQAVNQKMEPKEQKVNKSKNKQKVIQVKMEQEISPQRNQQQLYMPPQVQQVKKSRKKGNKTPGKKKSKR